MEWKEGIEQRRERGWDKEKNEDRVGDRDIVRDGGRIGRERQHWGDIMREGEVREREI